MKNVHKSVLIWYSAEEMFGLVTDVAKYCEFLPWCDRSKVIAREPDGMKAEVGINFSGIHQTFTTRNTHVAGRERGELPGAQRHFACKIANWDESRHRNASNLWG